MRSKPHTTSIDIWSLGICLHVLLSGFFPFISTDRKQTAKNIVFQKLNFNNSAWLKVSNQAKDLVSLMLQRNEEMRIVPEEILNHEWFTEWREMNAAIERQVKNYYIYTEPQFRLLFIYTNIHYICY